MSEHKGEIVPAGQGGGLGRAEIGAVVLPHSIAEVKDLAKIAVASRLMPAIPSPEAAFVIIATGMELGLSPMQALRGIHVVEGKPVLSADLIVALIKRSPLCSYFRLVESTPERATYTTLRNGEPEPTSLTWTVEMATRAELNRATGKGYKSTWQKHPEAMLRARCAAALGRAVYPDLLLGVYEESEGEEIREGARRPAPVREVAPAPVLEAEEAEYIDGPDPIGVLEDNIACAVLAASPAQWKDCVKQLRALGLSEGNPERTRLNGLLAEAKEKIAAAQPAPTPQPPAVEPGSDADEMFSAPGPTSAEGSLTSSTASSATSANSSASPLPTPTSAPSLPASPGPANSSKPAAQAKAWRQHSDDLSDLCRLGKLGVGTEEKKALDTLLHFILDSHDTKALEGTERDAGAVRWSEAGEKVAAQLLARHREFLAGGAK